MLARFFTIAVTAATLSLFATSSSATTMDCIDGQVDPTDRVTDGSFGLFACQFNANVASNSSGVYDDLFFGGGFTEILRDEDGEVGNGDVSTNGGTLGGDFQISASIASMYDAFVLVFKSANGDNVSPGEAVAYFLGSTLSGEYLTPFARTTGQCDGTVIIGCEREISHIALLGKTIDVPEVPLPAAGWMLLMGVAGMGVAKRRRK